MPNIRWILNKIKWTGKLDEDIEIQYIHRGAPGDTMTIRGSDIIEIGRSFIETKTAMIPYHRIISIRTSTEPIYQRYRKKMVK